MPVIRRLGWAAGLVLLAVALPAQAMPVSEFLKRWERLGTLGQMAGLDPDGAALTSELRGIVEGFRIDVDAGAKASKPIACPPPKGEAQLASGPLIAYLGGLSPTEQEAELKPALYAYLIKLYPCPAA
ncbi:MAG: hypothetical protein EOP62_16605 [Sphingomonadales bacterium]|nr:MAG: hypothetical protein EOP62_16605 [Sphingomonadales bacterium]